jgi:hypothetical protein
MMKPAMATPFTLDASIGATTLALAVPPSYKFETQQPDSGYHPPAHHVTGEGFDVLLVGVFLLVCGWLVAIRFVVVRVEDWPRIIRPGR